MRGHEGVIKSRLEGKAPTAVFIDVDGYSAVKPVDTYLERNPEVVIFPEERLSGIDLRFLVGLVVIIDGFDHKRVTAVHEECVKAKAKRVISNHLIWDRSEPRVHRVKTERTFDTEGTLNWESTDW